MASLPFLLQKQQRMIIGLLPQIQCLFRYYGSPYAIVWGQSMLNCVKCNRTSGFVSSAACRDNFLFICAYHDVFKGIPLRTVTFFEFASHWKASIPYEFPGTFKFFAVFLRSDNSDHRSFSKIFLLCLLFPKKIFSRGYLSFAATADTFGICSSSCLWLLPGLHPESYFSDFFPPFMPAIHRCALAHLVFSFSQ